MTVTSTKQYGLLRSNSPSNPNLSVNIRREPVIPPDSTSNIVARGKPGDRVEILGSTRPASDTHTWYRINYLPQSGIQGWVRDDVITILPPEDDDDPSSVAKYQLNVTTNTIFKTRPVDSSQLPDAEKVAIPANTTLAVSAYRQESSHYVCTLAYGQKIKGRNTWYIFQAHAQISQVN
ncbi:MAG: SH3 domain-containing protein [Nostocaceae cyanobacterium]|nr:SH3 domain-containing protein [Nostocaceae cyanobacterium]